MVLTLALFELGSVRGTLNGVQFGSNKFVIDITYDQGTPQGLNRARTGRPYFRSFRSVKKCHFKPVLKRRHHFAGWGSVRVEESTGLHLPLLDARLQSGRMAVRLPRRERVKWLRTYKRKVF